MTQEEKELLLKDLCVRLPYGIKVQVEYDAEEFGKTIETDEITMIDKYGKEILLYHAGEYFSIEELKPYLRPMSSMTEEERKEFSAFGFEVIDHINANREECPKYQVIEVSNFSGITEVIDWLNAHHFDYRGLIEKGLALEAPDGIYYLKQE